MVDASMLKTTRRIQPPGIVRLHKDDRKMIAEWPDLVGT
jgi:hypothetical protein